jgi:hypothetical protein
LCHYRQTNGLLRLEIWCSGKQLSPGQQNAGLHVYTADKAGPDRNPQNTQCSDTCRGRLASFMKGLAGGGFFLLASLLML